VFGVQLVIKSMKVDEREQKIDIKITLAKQMLY
jgi:hypothetical protein